jgi:hypothetical protein
VSEATTTTENETTQNEESKSRQATEYVVLAQISDGHGRLDWHEDGRYIANTPKDAIEQNGAEDGVTYVAIPARSWKPLTASKTVIEKITLQ